MGQSTLNYSHSQTLQGEWVPYDPLYTTFVDMSDMVVAFSHHYYTSSA